MARGSKRNRRFRSSKWFRLATRKANAWLATPRGQRALFFYLKTRRWMEPHLHRIQDLFERHPALRYATLVLASFLFLSTASGTFYFARVTGDVNGSDIDSVPQMEETTRVYDRNGKQIFEFFEKKRTIVPLARISKSIQQAVLAIEDRNFYDHYGYDVRGIVRAAITNVSSGKVRQGGSTLTQQLAKNTFLSSERSYRRKIQELWLARKIEKTYSKDQILEFYLNQVYLGSGFYGVEAAALGYFGKSAADVTLDEAALLAGLAKAPAVFSPHANSALALKRRNLVLEAMAECEFITSERASQARQQALNVRARQTDLNNANYAIDYVKEQLQEMFGAEQTFSGGMKVYTTIDASMQAAAEAAMENHLSRIEKQRGFGRFTRASYLKNHALDASGKETEPDYLQGALVSMNAQNGEIYALVGGRSFQESKFNRALYAKRQPGSTFKPIVYAAAMQSGMTPATVLQPETLEFETAQGLYLPTNNDGSKVTEAVTLRTALRKSINTTAIQVGQMVGIQQIIRTARDFGIEQEMPNVVSLPLGTGEVTLLEMVKAYSAFPNEGRVAVPAIITRVESPTGEILYENHPITRQAIDSQTAFLMTTILSDVVNQGTGSGVRAGGFRLPTAGKTGTTNDYRDAWFVGFTPDVVTGVWVGFDAPRQIMQRGYGATLAVPIWTEFMKKSFTKSSKKEFTMPPGIERVSVCAESGQLATSSCARSVASSSGEGEVEGEVTTFSVALVPTTYLEYFSADSAPKFPCQKHLTEHLVDSYGLSVLKVAATVTTPQ